MVEINLKELKENVFSKKGLGTLFVGSGGVFACLICLCILAFFIIVLVIFIFFISSFKTLRYDEYGLRYNSFTKYVHDKTYEPGIHYFFGAGFKFITFPRIFTTIEFSGGNSLNSRTSNGLSVSIDLSFQYRVEKENVYKLFLSFGEDYSSLIGKVARSVLRDVAGKYNATSFFTNRETIAEDMLSELSSFCSSNIFIEVSYLQMRSIEMTSGYEDIIEEKEIVKQEILKAEIMREKNLTEAETEVLYANEIYSATLKNASAEADGIILVANSKANASIISTEADIISLKNLQNDLGLDLTQVVDYLWIKAIESHSDSSLFVDIQRPVILKF